MVTVTESDTLTVKLNERYHHAKFDIFVTSIVSQKIAMLTVWGYAGWPAGRPRPAKH